MVLPMAGALRMACVKFKPPLWQIGWDPIRAAKNGSWPCLLSCGFSVFGAESLFGGRFSIGKPMYFTVEGDVVWCLTH